jgi:shikimate kinase
MPEAASATETIAPSAATIRQRLKDRNIVLVGMMGAGKSSVGRRLAAALDLPFSDADAEIELAANQTIPEIFANFGEEHFRNGERRVIARLLKSGPQVIATGGGAFMNTQTRRAIAKRGISVWLKADLAVLMERVRRKSNRPLLKEANPETVMRRLLTERTPIYELADITVASRDTPHADVVSEVLSAVDRFIDAKDEE